MRRTDARQTFGYGDLADLALTRRAKGRTLGYHQLPNGEVNPLALGAPLTLAPPVTLVRAVDAATAPTGAASDMSEAGSGADHAAAPPMSSSRRCVERLPVATLRRATDDDDCSNGMLSTVVDRNRASWNPRTRSRMVSLPPSLRAAESRDALANAVAAAQTRATRRAVARVLAALVLVPCLVLAAYSVYLAAADAFGTAWPPPRARSSIR